MDFPRYTGNEPCRQMDPELFFPVSFNTLGEKHRALLMRLCDECDSRPACLLWALRHENEGWWGGTTPHQREQLRKLLRIQYQSITLRGFLEDQEGKAAA